MQVTLLHNHPIPLEMLEAADKDPFLDGIVGVDVAKERTAILVDNEIVGFFTPRMRDGYYRTGAIYVDPLYRNKGVGKAVVQQFFIGKKGEALIEDGNIASINAFTSAGFVKDQLWEDDVYWYVKEQVYFKSFEQFR